MAKFKQKSPVVDAIVWGGDNEKAVKNFLPKGMPPPLFTKDGAVDLWTSVGIIRAKQGFFIIKDADGDVGVCGSEGFVRAFECIPETDAHGKKDYEKALAHKAAMDKQLKEGHSGQK